MYELFNMFGITYDYHTQLLMLLLIVRSVVVIVTGDRPHGRGVRQQRIQ